jgi:hypothetical protein
MNFAAGDPSVLADPNVAAVVTEIADLVAADHLAADEMIDPIGHPKVVALRRRIDRLRKEQSLLLDRRKDPLTVIVAQVATRKVHRDKILVTETHIPRPGVVPQAKDRMRVARSIAMATANRRTVTAAPVRPHVRI